MSTIGIGFNENFDGVRLISDYNQDTFRYGLQKYTNSQFEDPTYLGFTIELDENCPLFTEVLPFLENRGAYRKELRARIPVYQEFINKVRMVFNSQESVLNDFEKSVFIKQHYINSISGLDGLTKKFNIWKEDKLEFQLHEDITLFSNYLASLYNNLTWSYENGRELIPENLLKFNLHIKISEIRSLTSIGLASSQSQQDQQIYNALKNNVTSITYTLYDCLFNFMESKPFTDEIAQSGIDATNPGHSIVDFEIYYKSVSRIHFNPLVENALTMNDLNVDLSLLVVGGSGALVNRAEWDDTVDWQHNFTSSPESGFLTNNDGSPFQKKSYAQLSTHNKMTFLAENRKPTDLNQLNLRNKKESDTSDPDDLNIINDETIEMTGEGSLELTEKQKRIASLQDFNLEHAPNIQELNNRNYDKDLATDIIGEYNRKAGMSDFERLLEDPQQAANKSLNNIRLAGEDAINLAKQRSIDRIKQGRNQLIRTFVYDVADTVGITKITPANVYTDNNYFINQLQSIYNAMGSSITDDVINILTGN